jgi:hypothetical protein
MVADERHPILQLLFVRRLKINSSPDLRDYLIEMILLSLIEQHAITEDEAGLVTAK